VVSPPTGGLVEIKLDQHGIVLLGQIANSRFHLPQKVFFKPDLHQFGQIAFFVQKLCLGGITGAAVFPISMRQMTLISSAEGGVLPVMSDVIVAAAVFAILMVMNPVFGTPVGHRHNFRRRDRDTDRKNIVVLLLAEWREKSAMVDLSVTYRAPSPMSCSFFAHPFRVLNELPDPSKATSARPRKLGLWPQTCSFALRDAALG
jgi:hypothetical protein